jgi:hypothetical protein
MTADRTPSGEHGPWQLLAYPAAADLTAMAGVVPSVPVARATFKPLGCSDRGWFWGTTFIGGDR